MHVAAQSKWYDFIVKYEGNIPYMYLDTKRLVTVGVGNLIDPISLARLLPFWFRADNNLRRPIRRATVAEIEAEWTNLKVHPERDMLARRGHLACRSQTNLELPSDERMRFFRDRTSAIERQLKAHFSGYDSWPGDAQMGLMAMGWGMGGGFPSTWPKFTSSCKKLDFDTAVKECNVRDWRPERNDASSILFSNAARVLKNPKSYRIDIVYYPTVLLDTVTVTSK